MSGFQGRERKRKVRHLWLTPILEGLLAHLGRKYFYLGLPGPQAEDISDWCEMIERVCAFELEAKGEDKAKDLADLEQKLNMLGEKHQIAWDTYFGSLERVVILGNDVYGKRYSQDQLVTLYQLDYCQAYTGYTPYTDKIYRYNSIRKLLAHQYSLPAREQTRPFVAFITVRDEIHTSALTQFLSEDLPASDREVFSQLIEEKALDTDRTWSTKHPVLKAFVFYTLKQMFADTQVHALFLPPVYYLGNRDAQDPMVVFSAVGCFDIASQQCQLPQTLQAYMRLRGYTLEGDIFEPTSRSAMEEGGSDSYKDAISACLDQFCSNPVWKQVETWVAGLDGSPAPASPSNGENRIA